MALEKIEDVNVSVKFNGSNVESKRGPVPGAMTTVTVFSQGTRRHAGRIIIQATKPPAAFFDDTKQSSGSDSE